LINLAGDYREFGAVWINTTGKEYHMDHIKQPYTANKAVGLAR
jgi:hypothetical protein